MKNFTNNKKTTPIGANTNKPIRAIAADSI